MQTTHRSRPPARLSACPAQAGCARAETLFAGIGVHKDTDTAAGISPFGEKIFETTMGNEAEDFISLVEKAKVEAARSGLTPHFGLEDVHSWGERFSSFLAEEGLPAVATAPVLVDYRRSKRSGNRRLNRAFHRMALSQISRSGNDATRTYFKRKIQSQKYVWPRKKLKKENQRRERL